MVEAVHLQRILPPHQPILQHHLNILPLHPNILPVHRFINHQAVKVVTRHLYHQHLLNILQHLQRILHLNHHHVIGLFPFLSLIYVRILLILVQHLPSIVLILVHHVIVQHLLNILLNPQRHQPYLHQYLLHALMMTMMIKMIMEILWIKSETFHLYICLLDKNQTQVFFSSSSH